MDVSKDEVRKLLAEKYAGDAGAAGFAADQERLACGEPLAYVIGWQPFLGLSIGLESKPLIPRPETEWWTEALIEHLRSARGTMPFALLDLCAGSGAIGLAVLAALPNARVSFGELSPAHTEQIRRNLKRNGLDASRADIRAGDLFEPFASARFDCIAANPPYIPADRVLDESVAAHEPAEALFADADGLGVIRRIAAEAAAYLNPDGELWLECDTSNVEAAAALLADGGARRAEVRADQYDRPRLAIGYY